MKPRYDYMVDSVMARAKQLGHDAGYLMCVMNATMALLEQADETYGEGFR